MYESTGLSCMVFFGFKYVFAATESCNKRSSPAAGRRSQKTSRMRRGRPLTSQTAFGGQLPYKGSLVRPAVRFHHSLFEYNGRFLRATNHEPRATNHEPRATIFHEPRVTRDDVVILSLLPQSGILSPRRPANCGLQPAAVRPIHRIVDKVAISLYNRNTYSYSMKLAEKGDFIDEF